MNSGQGSVIAVVVLVITSRWEDSTVANVLWFAAMAYLFGGILLRARAGYRRRLPYWTRESWRRYFAVCAMFAAVLLIFLAMAAAVEFRLPITGSSQSTARMIWAVVMMSFMVVGMLGLTSAVLWLNEGDDPTKQFTQFQKRPPPGHAA